MNRDLTWYFCYGLWDWVSSDDPRVKVYNSGRAHIFFDWFHGVLQPVNELTDQEKLDRVLQAYIRNTQSLENARKAGVTHLTEDLLTSTGILHTDCYPTITLIGRRILLDLPSFSLTEQQFIEVMPKLGAWVLDATTTQIETYIRDQI